MILNLTQHPASPEQVAAGVVDLPPADRAHLVSLLTVDTLPTRQEITDRCADIAALASLQWFAAQQRQTRVLYVPAMIGGAPWMMSALEGALAEVGIQPVYAFSVRESAEQPQPDGSVRKVNVFRHAGWVTS